MLDQCSRADDGRRDPGEEVVLELVRSGIADGPTIRAAGAGDGLKLVIGLTGGSSQRLRPLRSVPVINDAVEGILLAVEVIAHRPTVRSVRARSEERRVG